MRVMNAMDFFVRELDELLSGERTLLQGYRGMREQAHDPRLEQLLVERLQAAEEHVLNLRLVFEQLGREPLGEASPGASGIVEGYRLASRRLERPELTDLLITGAALRAASYEVAGYMGLMELARDTRLARVVGLLRENLDDEVGFSQRLANLSVHLAQRLWETEDGGQAEPHAPSPGGRRAT